LASILAKAPNHAMAHFFLGAMQVVSNRAAQSVHQFLRALTLDRNLAEAYAYTGLANMVVGRAQETESHIIEALRYSPRDTHAYIWAGFAGSAKLYLGADNEAVAWLRRSIEINRNYPIAHLSLAATLAHLGSLDEARAETEALLSIDPKFTIRRFRLGVLGDNPTYLTQRERVIDGLRKAEVPEG
jgi:tetratricopeptide (TPR) repeat protein